MKKTFVTAAALFMLGITAASADKLVSPVQTKEEGTKLVDMNSSSGQLNQLERRLDDLERQVRDQNTAMRHLERDLSDLRRRR